jgi:hypothetical protein
MSVSAVRRRNTRRRPSPPPRPPHTRQNRTHLQPRRPRNRNTTPHQPPTTLEHRPQHPHNPPHKRPPSNNQKPRSPTSFTGQLEAYGLLPPRQDHDIRIRGRCLTAIKAPDSRTNFTTPRYNRTRTIDRDDLHQKIAGGRYDREQERASRGRECRFSRHPGMLSIRFGCMRVWIQ